MSRSAFVVQSAMTLPPLPPQVRVIVRDWLNANQIVLKSSAGNVVIDSGFGACAARTLELLRAPDALGDEPLARLVNTHCHSDHMGGNAAIRRAYRCRVSIPAGEAPHILAWDEKALWYGYAGQVAERFDFDDTIAPGDRLRMGDLEWIALDAGGHDMGALMFHCPGESILVSGDALWEHGFGVVVPEPDGETRLASTRATLETIARLGVEIVIPGHGKPFADVDKALHRAFQRLGALAADRTRMARHTLKVMLTYNLLAAGRMVLADLPGYLDRVDLFRDYNATFFGHSPEKLAEWLVAELERSGAATREGGWLMPSHAAAEN